MHLHNHFTHVFLVVVQSLLFVQSLFFFYTYWTCTCSNTITQLAHSLSLFIHCIYTSSIHMHLKHLHTHCTLAITAFIHLLDMIPSFKIPRSISLVCQNKYLCPNFPYLMQLILSVYAQVLIFSNFDSFRIIFKYPCKKIKLIGWLLFDLKPKFGKIFIF